MRIDSMNSVRTGELEPGQSHYGTKDNSRRCKDAAG